MHRLYSSTMPIYIKEHPQILVSEDVLELISVATKGQLCILRQY